MKKLLSILGIIGLTTTSTTTLISCDKPNNNENGGGNKPKPKPQPPQEPPIGSKWKLIDKNTVISEIDNKYYFAIKEDRPGINQWFSYLILNDKVFNLEWINILLKKGTVYIWNLQNEPTKPDIDKNTGKITDWKE